MGWAPRTLNVTLPDTLRALAGGVHVITCRYLGGGQIERIGDRPLSAGHGAYGEGWVGVSAGHSKTEQKKLEDDQQLSNSALTGAVRNDA